MISSSLVYANWQPSSGPYGGIIQSLVFSENLIVAGCHGNESGVYISENNGSTWEKVINIDGTINHSPEIMVKNMIRKDLEDVFYIAAENGIYKLYNSENDWKIQTIGFKNPQSVITDITYTNNTIFVSFWENGIRKSTDEGQTWSIANVGLSEYNASALAHAGDTIYAGTENGLYVSYDQGEQWSFFDENLVDHYIIKVLVDDKHICLAEFRAGAFVYGKDGALISRADPVGEFETSIIPFSLVNGKLYGQYKNTGLYSSDINSISWEKSSDRFDYTKPLSLIEINGNILIGTGGFGVFNSSDNGLTWQESSVGIKAYAVNALESLGGKVFIATSVSGFFISEDQGFSWRQASNGLLGNTFNDILIKDDKIFLAGYGLYVSTDDGQTFTQKDPRYFTDITANDNTIFTASLNEGIITSSDDGETWQEMSFNYDGNPIYAIEARDSIVVIGAHYDSPFLSTDNGQSWTSIQQNLSGHAVRSIAFKESAIFMTTGCGVGECNQPTGAYRSSDLGKTWQYKNKNIGYELVDIYVSQGIIFGSAANNMFYSLNNGTSWEKFSNQIISGNGRIHATSNNTGQISSFAATPQYLYLGTDQGLLYQDNHLKAITGIGKSGANNKINSTTVYPNPFSGRAIISYSLDSYEPELQLIIFDQQGRKIWSKSLAENWPGIHSLEFQPLNLKRGVYTYRLLKSSSIDSGRIVFSDPL